MQIQYKREMMARNKYYIVCVIIFERLSNLVYQNSISTLEYVNVLTVNYLRLSLVAAVVIVVHPDLIF